MIKLTLEISWNDIRSYKGRYVKTVEGPKIDILSLKKAELKFGINDIKINDKTLEFNEKHLKGKWDDILQNKSIIYFIGANSNGADGFVRIVNQELDNATIYFYDSKPVEKFNMIQRKDITIPLLGYDFDSLFNLLEESGVINRVSYYSFLVNNKDAFYKFFGEKRLSFDETIEKIKNHFSSSAKDNI